MEKTLDTKLAALKKDPASRVFILADAKDADMAFGRPRKSGDDPQQRRLAAARAAEQRDDLALAQSERNVLQHRRAGFAGALRIGLTDVADVEQDGGGGVEHERVSGQD